MDTSYKLFASLACFHAYFGEVPPRCRVLRLRPTAACARLLRNHDLLLRSESGGASLWHGSHAEMVLPTLESPLRLAFLLDVSDPLFENYTDLSLGESPLGPTNAVYYFSNRQAAAQQTDVGGAPRLLLHEAPQVKTADRLPIRPPTFAYTPAAHTPVYVLDEAGTTVWAAEAATPDTPLQVDLRRQPPGRYRLAEGDVETDTFGLLDGPASAVWGLLEIVVGRPQDGMDAAYALLDAAGAFRRPAFSLSFETRSTIWRYLIVERTKNGKAEPKVVGQRAGQAPIAFAQKASQTLVGSGAAGLRTAQVFESSEAIPLKERPDEALTFRLKSGGQTYLLPYARPAVVRPEPPRAPEQVVSEIYVYL